MAFVFRPTIIRHKKGRKVRSKGKHFHACYVSPLDGEEKRHALALPSGAPVTNREVAEKVLRDLLERRQREAAGLTNAYVDAASTPVRKLLADYVRHLRRKRVKGRPLRRSYVKEALRVGKWLIDRGVAKVAELNAANLDTALGTLTALRKSAKTFNIYRSHIHGLCEYGVSIAKAIEANPVKQIAAHGRNPTRVRRALTFAEAEKLLQYAGPRALWYEFALYTGLRVAEIAALRWSDLDLDSLTPCVRLRAVTTKSGRADTVPLKRTLADKLRKQKPDPAQPKARVFLTTPTRATFKSDCTRAGIVLADDRGRVVDRHALRHTFISWLSVAGVTPRVAQKLARHTSIDLTMRVYTDETLLNATAAGEGLPDLGTDDHVDAERAALRPTGTDGDCGEVVVPPVVPDVVLTGGESTRHNATCSIGAESECGVNDSADASCRVATCGVADEGEMVADGLEPSTCGL